MNLLNQFPLGSSSSTCSGAEPLGSGGTQLFKGLDALPAKQWSVSKHWREQKAQSLTSGLASSFLHPLRDGRGVAASTRLWKLWQWQEFYSISWVNSRWRNADQNSVFMYATWRSCWSEEQNLSRLIWKIALNAVRLPKFEPVNGILWSPRKIMVKDLRQCSRLAVILSMRRELHGL